MSGTLAERSQRVFFPVILFSPMWYPWSDQRTTTVFSARPVSSRASRTRPTHQLMHENKHPYGNMACLVNALEKGQGAS